MVIINQIQMENRIYQSQAALNRSHSSQKLKFKQIPLNDQEYNELNSKYELYKRGTPNTYSQDLNSLKAKNIKNDVAMMELPAIDSIINHLSRDDKEKQINQRNYDLYPNLLKQSKTRYKEMLSEKQQIKDFIVWFQNQYQSIEKSNESSTKKFQNKQTLIAAGFNQMIGQVSKTSKNRAEILKMLWNRQNQEIGYIIEILNSQNIKKQRNFLEQISKIHQEYQNQIDSLRKSNKDFDEDLSKQKNFNRTLIQNLRILRKRIKKLEYLVKKLSESNINTKKQNLNLIEENIKLLMNIKQISQEEAVILNYRRLQVYQQKDKLKHQKTKKIIKLAEVKQEPENLTPLQDLDDKKKALFDYFLQRLKENPDQKIFIKEEYFTDEEENVANIEDYFKNIINRPNIKMELLNQCQPTILNKEKGVNTDFIDELVVSIPSIRHQKGIQVQLIDPTVLKDQIQNGLREGERKVYQIISHKEEEHLEKESKKRIIKHRISRKNSLTLLQIQGLNEMNNSKFNNKRGMLSSFGKKNKLNQSSQSVHKHLQAIDSELHLISQSEVQSQTEILAINNFNKGSSELTLINVNPNLMKERKSINFQNLLQKIHDKSDYINQKQVEHIIKLEQDLQEIKFSQLEDLISKHLIKNQENKTVQNPEKFLNKILHSLYKNIALKKQYNFIFELLEVIKNSYGNTKSVICKFLNIVTVIKSYSNNNSLLKIVSIFLKINEKFKLYNDINREELPEMYFKLFFFLTIKGVNQTTFNLWKACTSLEKVKSLEFIAIMEQFFSTKKRNYIQNKLEQLIAVNQQQNNKKSHLLTSKKQVKEDNSQIVKLNSVLLYVLEVYLIEKELYYSSYSQMIEFINIDGCLPVDFFVWIIDFLGFNEERQNQILKFIFAKKTSLNAVGSQNANKNGDKNLKNDFFYKLCVKFDMPLFQQLSVTAFTRFKLLPQQIQQKYYRMIGVEQWNEIKYDLIKNYKMTFNSQIYFKAFMLIIDKLEYQIKKGASIYGEDSHHDKIKRKQQIFSLFYKIIIIEAHRNLIEKSKQEMNQI